MKRVLVMMLVVLTLVCMGTLLASAQEAEKKQEETAQASEKEEIKKIDVNSATLEQLETLPDIGPKLAQAIIDNRPYATIEDVKTKVKGIGEKKFEAIKDLIEAKPIEGSKQDEMKQENTTPAAEGEKKE